MSSIIQAQIPVGSRQGLYMQSDVVDFFHTVSIRCQRAQLFIAGRTAMLHF